MNEVAQLKRLMEAIEGELITKDRGSAAGIARDIIKGASQSLYKEGTQPTPEAIKKRADIMAARYHSQVLMAIDNELGK